MSTITVEPYPFGKRFAVTLTDDTDGATLAGIEPVYGTLVENGIRITKTVWPLRQIEGSGDFPFEGFSGATLQDADYVEFLRDLAGEGFEIALHNASAGNNPRERTIEAYDLFARIFGHDPATNIMHRRNRENIYWGKELISNRLLRRCIALFEPQQFHGHDPTSPYYWGDLCRTRSRYVRGLQTLGTNTLRFDPSLPHHDPERPDVPFWFSATYAVGTRLFDVLSPERIEELRRDRGTCIAYIYCMHYAVRDGDGYRVHPRFAELARRLAGAGDGWYVPVRDLLDRFRAVRDVEIVVGNGEIAVVNRGRSELEDVAIRMSEPRSLYDAEARNLAAGANALGQIPIGTLAAGEMRLLSMDTRGLKWRPSLASKRSELRLALGTIRRIAWQYLHGRRGRGNRASGHRPKWVGDLTAGSGVSGNGLSGSGVTAESRGNPARDVGENVAPINFERHADGTVGTRSLDGR